MSNAFIRQGWTQNAPPSNKSNSSPRVHVAKKGVTDRVIETVVSKKKTGGGAQDQGPLGEYNFPKRNFPASLNIF